MKKYRKRIIEEQIKNSFIITGVTLIEGPKACGKTTTAKKLSKSFYQFQEKFVDINRNVIDYLLSGETPRLIDEWQLTPKIWDAIRYEVDERGLKGQFILTGSYTPINEEEIMHSGAGRFSFLLMRPMSLFESEDSSGEVSLKELFDNKNIDIFGKNDTKIQRLAELICRGGFPETIDMNIDDAIEYNSSYLQAIVKSDISRINSTVKNESLIMAFLKSYSRFQSQRATKDTIKEDMIKHENMSLSGVSICSLLNSFRNIFLIEELSAWSPKLRSKTAIRTSKIRLFVDPCIATSALMVGPNDLLENFNTFGFLFESMVIRDLRVYAESLKGSVFTYRDKDDLECDAVLHIKHGKYALVEIKLGGEEQIEEAAKNLKTLFNKIDTDSMNKPSFMMIITGTTEFAYRRNDGIYVVPITCLRN